MCESVCRPSQHPLQTALSGGFNQGSGGVGHWLGQKDSYVDFVVNGKKGS